MPPVPQRRSLAHLVAWVNPAWRKSRASERRAWAWAGLCLTLACYLLACLYLAPGAGPAITLLYGIPCALAGWGFGASGGLSIALLATPVHAWLSSHGVVDGIAGSTVVALGLAGALVIGVGAGLAREVREAMRVPHLSAEPG